MASTPNGAAAKEVVCAGKAVRDLTPVARALAEVLIAENTDLADEREVEKVIRVFHPVDIQREVDLLVAMCPDIARAIAADPSSPLPVHLFS